MNFRRLYQIRRWPRLLRWFGWFVLFVLAFYVFEDIHGRVRLAMAQAKWEKQGITFDLEKLWPEPVPDEENFYAHPVIAEFLNESTYRDCPLDQMRSWHVDQIRETERSPDEKYLGYRFGRPREFRRLFKDDLSEEEAARRVLSVIGQWNGDLERVKEAATRPSSYLPPLYGKYDLINRYRVYGALEKPLQTRLLANVKLSNGDEVLRDLRLLVNVSKRSRNHAAVLDWRDCWLAQSRISEVTWEGLAAGIWTEPQLRELDALLASTEVLHLVPESLQRELAMNERLLRKFAYRRWNFAKFRGFNATYLDPNSGAVSPHQDLKYRFMHVGFLLLPSGWFFQNVRSYQELAVETVVAPGSSLSFGLTIAQVDNLISRANALSWTPYKVVPHTESRFLPDSLEWIIYGQQNIDLARLAVALERYRMRNGGYPDSLDALTPEFLDFIPNDRFEPTRSISFEHTKDGRYRLYAVGKNRLDENGRVRRGSNVGDIVWQYLPAEVPGLQRSPAHTEDSEATLDELFRSLKNG